MVATMKPVSEKQAWLESAIAGLNPNDKWYSDNYEGPIGYDEAVEVCKRNADKLFSEDPLAFLQCEFLVKVGLK